MKTLTEKQQTFVTSVIQENAVTVQRQTQNLYQVPSFGMVSIQSMKGLILAQNERWRRGLGMRVVREPARGKVANGVVMRR